MYAIEHDNKAYTPNGLDKSITDTNAHNQEVERQEIEHIKTGPDHLFLYVRPPQEKTGLRAYWKVITFLGTELGNAWIGERAHIGFGWHSYRRAITVRIFGVLYHGWYMESSGDYCRLKKAKKQDAKYAASI